MSEKVFHHLLSKVGDSHRYQALVTLFCSITGMQISINGFLNAYLFYQNDYQCAPDVANCHDYVCSLAPDQRSAYVDPSFTSMISRFGDYRCEVGGDPEYAQIFIYLGGVVGAVASVFMLSFMTTRRMIIFSTGCSLFGLLIALFSHSLLLLTIGLSLNFMGRCANAGIQYTYLSDTVGERHRILYVSVTMISFTIGVPVLALAYWLIHPWEIALIAVSLVPLLLNFLGFVLLLEDTPLEMVTTRSTDQALKGLGKISSINGLEFTLTQQDIGQVKAEYEKNQQSMSHHYRLSFIDLLSFKSLRAMTLLLIFSRFLVNYIFVGIGLMVKDYALNPYLNGLLMGVSEVLCAIFAKFTLQKWPRIRTSVVGYVIGFISTLVLFVAVPCTAQESCTGLEVTLQTVGVFIFRFLSCYIYLFHVVQITELYLSQVKSIAMQVLSLISAASFMIVPAVQSAFQSAHTSPFIALSLCSFVLIFLTLPLDETVGVPPPEMIQELRYESAYLQQEKQRQHSE